MAENGVREILIIRVSRIGDTLLVTPAIRAVARAFPDARVTCLAHPKRAEVLEHLPFVHRVGKITKHRARLMGWLGRKRFDLAFVYGNDKPLAAYALRVARKVVAFKQGDEALDRRLYQAVDPPAFQSMHAVHLHLALVAALNVPAAGYALAYRVTEEESRWARAILDRELPKDAGPLVGLQVASFPTKAYRDWPIEHFVALCERIVARYPRAHFLIFGGSLEKSRTDALHKKFSRQATLFAGKLTLRQTAALMSRVDAYVGVDTGPTHIMGTLGIPMVALYHCQSPWALIGPLDHPCLYAVDHPRAGGPCTPDTPMAEISVDTVWTSFEAALAHQPTRQAVETQ